MDCEAQLSREPFSAWISVSGFTLDAWSNLALRDTTERTRPCIMEASLQYDRDWRKLRIKPTLEADFYHDPLNVESPEWVESSVRVSYPAGLLRMFAAQSFEISDSRGAYFGEAGIEYERRLPRNTELQITPSIGWASAKFSEASIGVPKVASNLVAVEGSLTHYVNRNLYLRPELGPSQEKGGAFAPPLEFHFRRREQPAAPALRL